MNFSILGFKVNVLNAVIFIILGFLIATHTTCACSKVSVKEAMTNLANSATLDHNNNADVSNSWISKSLQYAGNMGYQSILDKHQQYKGTPVPLENTLFYFQDNEFKPECCPSDYTTSSGCLCKNKQTRDMLIKRGGNSTTNKEVPLSPYDSCLHEPIASQCI